MAKRIVVYDYHPKMLALFDILLRSQGFEVFTCSEPLSSFHEIETLEPDLIIFGHLVGYDGHELNIIRELRENRYTSRIPILICSTNSAYLQSCPEIMNAERLLVIPKPFDVQRLISAIHRLLQKTKSETRGIRKTHIDESSAFAPVFAEQQFALSHHD
jgi:DNA-binding response OmpR family regulator